MHSVSIELLKSEKVLSLLEVKCCKKGDTTAIKQIMNLEIQFQKAIVMDLGSICDLFVSLCLIKVAIKIGNREFSKIVKQQMEKHTF